MSNQPQVLGSPAQMMMGVDQGDIFQSAKKLFIKQEFAAIEMCSVEAKQRYRVSQATADNTEGNVFLYIGEESNCLERVCCSVNRSLTLQVHEGQTKEGNILMSMKKPFSLQNCCCLRPRFDVFAGTGDREEDKIGTVEDPCRFCWMDQQINDPSGNLLFTTAGCPCQAGMFCPCCAGIEFEVKKNESVVGKVEKLPMDCAELCLKTNRFVVDFGQLTGEKERKLLLASAMLLDLAYFEQNKNN